jgi:putative membrane protein
MRLLTKLATAAAGLAIFAAGCSGPGNVNVAGNGTPNSSNLNSVGSNPNREPATNSNSGANTTAQSPAMSDTDFMREAAIGGMSEVELGKLASSKAAGSEVKGFGQMMVSDHSKANEELKALAAKKNVTLPTEPDAAHKSTMTALQAKSGADFDREYVSEMIEDHEKDVAAFQDKSQNASDPDVKAFAAKTLPTLRKHLEAIRTIQAKMATPK